MSMGTHFSTPFMGSTSARETKYFSNLGTELETRSIILLSHL